MQLFAEGAYPLQLVSGLVTSTVASSLGMYASIYVKWQLKNKIRVALGSHTPVDRGYGMHKVKITIVIGMSALAFVYHDFSLASAPGFYSSSVVDDPESLGLASFPGVQYMPVEVFASPTSGPLVATFTYTTMQTQLECSAQRKDPFEQSQGI